MQAVAVLLDTFAPVVHFVVVEERRCVEGAVAVWPIGSYAAVVLLSAGAVFAVPTAV